ncbi:MAG: hypothetical protein PHV06_04435 [bacterium]|nr:hypothetical protein [bacterium]
MEQNQHKEELMHEIDNHRKTLKITTNVLWFLIIAIGISGTYLFFKFMERSQYYSNIYGATQDGVMENKFGKIIYEKKGIEIIINEKGETIENVAEWSKKNYFKYLYLGILMVAVTVGLIAFLININKNLMKRKVHLEFKLEKLKYEGITAAEDWEKKHPL